MLLAFIRLPYSYINQAGSLPQANHRTEQGLLVYPYFDFFSPFPIFFSATIFWMIFIVDLGMMMYFGVSTRPNKVIR